MAALYCRDGVPTLDFWLEYASTYSYPAAERIAAAERATGVSIRWRPFLLGPIFQAQGWNTSPFNIYPPKGCYMWRDLERICEGLGLPLAVRPISAKQHPGRARRADRLCRGLGRGIFARGLPRRVRRRRQYRRPRRDGGHAGKSRCRACSNTRKRRKTRRVCAAKPRKRSASVFSARRVSSPPTANYSGVTIGSKRRLPGRNPKA